jgi:endonuclease/exonuclease/phosphatase family metal-dependent hydrolase
LRTAAIRLATWNLNNRVGKVRFRPEAAHAAVALGADFVVLTEYFPQQHHRQFCQVLAESGWIHQLLSHEPDEIANRTLIASRLLLERDSLALPDFDRQFPANTVAAHFPTLGLRVLGLRVPAYKPRDPLLLRGWEWLETAAARLRETPAVILGDLNVGALPDRKGVGACFRKILDSGWERATPAGGYSYFGLSGERSEIDHVLATPRCTVRGAEYLTSLPSFNLAGTPGALSDHAALVADIDIH